MNLEGAYGYLKRDFLKVLKELEDIAGIDKKKLKDAVKEIEEIERDIGEMGFVVIGMSEKDTDEYKRTVEYIENASKRFSAVIGFCFFNGAWSALYANRSGDLSDEELKKLHDEFVDDFEIGMPFDKIDVTGKLRDPKEVFTFISKREQKHYMKIENPEGEEKGSTFRDYRPKTKTDIDMEIAKKLLDNIENSYYSGVLAGLQAFYRSRLPAKEFDAVKNMIIKVNKKAMAVA